jgi:hypothetical protein
LAFQLDGLCRGLEIAAQTQQPVSQLTIEVLSKLEADMLGVSSGEWIDGWPATNNSATLGDLLVKAETLRAAIQGFFSPEELSEYQSVAGFDLKRMHDARKESR